MRRNTFTEILLTKILNFFKTLMPLVEAEGSTICSVILVDQ